MPEPIVDDLERLRTLSNLSRNAELGGLVMEMVKNMARALIETFAAAACSGFIAVALAGTALAAELVWVGDFEAGDFSQVSWNLKGEGFRSSKRIVTSPVRSGKYAAELVILAVGNPGGINRAELVTHLPGYKRFEWDGPEYWIGFSFLFKEWNASAYTFFQIHAPNEPSGECDWAGNTFSIWADGEKNNDGIADKLGVRVIENGGVSEANGAASNNTRVHSYPIPLNSWQDYVVNFRLSTRGVGFYQIWKNGEKIYSKTGLTNVNYLDSCGQPIPVTYHNGLWFGVYSDGSADYRRIFYDEVRIAEGADGYDLVAPGGDSNSPPDSSVPKPNPPTITTVEAN